ncbi:synaptopodin-2 isoform X2 [Betta splendens]|uniref:Synaptopodin-2 isoform X2 n=1 Tax=Betta splendens TaxID=158456 RepID=A0A6P7PTW4_BETSP|nr:synaptopodin-2 isoform X2 [Betta splendens]
MGTGDYICVTLRGGSPWGFTLREGEGDSYRPLLTAQVEEAGRAFLAGVREGDEVVSLNGEPCADLSLLRALALIDTSIDCLQLLLKRYCSTPPDDYESEVTLCGDRLPDEASVESTTLHIFSPRDRTQSPRELIISELQGEGCCDDRGNREPVFRGADEEAQRCFSPGDMVELQVSLSEQTLGDAGCTSLGSALGIEGELSNREAIETVHTSTASHFVPCPARKPLSQRGVVLGSPSMLGQVEVTLQQPAASEEGRGVLSVGGPRVSGSDRGGEGGGHCAGVPGSFTVSFGLPSEEATPAEEQDSDSEGDQDKPNKHRARHARLRRSESLSEKQVKEAKSKCKHIALLLTAAPPNPNNKGVLMFKKHRQRAKKYTLVSYGTGDDEPEYSDDDDEEARDGEQPNHTVEFTLVAPNSSEIEKHIIANTHSGKGVLTINWDKGLLEIERNLNNQEEMESLPETKGKGALMFAQRRQRMDEITAEHEELRRQGIPVEGVQEAEKKTMEQSYMQSTTESHAYMDVNIHQQSQHQQQYKQYQEQQYYEQQQHYQQQQQYQQQYQQEQYEQQNYLQQQMYQQQQQQEYHHEQQQMQHYAANINGTVQHQSSEMQSSLSNRTAKPFSLENMAATPYSSAMSGTNQDSVGQGEQIASRDERISTPANRTGILMDTKRKGAGKPMFTFKEAPKVSPNPELLNLLNRSDKKLGFESGPEEDYLSLGAEACNFLQSQRVKHKTPPPVAPKPMINPNAPPWSPQTEMTNQDMPQCAENSVSTPAIAPTIESSPAPELEPTPAPAPEPSPPPTAQGAPASTATEEQHTWTLPEPQQPQQLTAHEDNVHMNSTPQPDPAPVNTWATAQIQVQPQPHTNSWHQAQVQPQEPVPSQSPPQPPWVTRQSSQTQAQAQLSINTWSPQIQPSWGQPQDQAQPQTHAQQSWAQPREQPPSQPQVQAPWAQSLEQPHPQPTWGQRQEPVQQLPQASWTRLSETDTQHQQAWVQQSQAQPPWVRPVQPESQQQPPWVQQPQHQAPQQAWQQVQAPGQPQQPWASVPPQQPQQPSVNAWPSSPAQLQPAPVQPQATLNPWAPVPPQPQFQSSWTQEQNQAQNQAPWGHPVQPQHTSQAKWTPSTPSKTPQPQMNVWPASETQPQTPVNAWAPQPQQTPSNVHASMVNTRPSPKPWQPPQHATHNQTPPPPPQRMHSFSLGQRVSSPINPMATVLNPQSPGSAFEMPAVRGKGADMFAKRQSRMEKYIVDSETVQANKASRSASPTASLPSEWRYTPNALGRSYSLSPPVRGPSTAQRAASASSFLKHQTPRPEGGRKPPSPWEAASRHPLGLVDEAFAFRNLQQTLVSNIHLAAQRKKLPEPPAQWRARTSFQASPQTDSRTWSPSPSRSRSSAGPSIASSAPSPAPVGHAGYSSLPRQWRPQKSVTPADPGPPGAQTYKSVYSSKWSWRR